MVGGAGAGAFPASPASQATSKYNDDIGVYTIWMDPMVS